MSVIPELRSGAIQLAERLARLAGPGFSRDPVDYRPTAVKLSGPEFNPMDRAYRPDIDPAGFLIGKQAIAPEGVSVIVVGTLSGCQERDRVNVGGKETTRLHAIWKRQPQDTTPIKGKGGGLRTGRGGWITGKFDEIFLLAPGPCVLTLFDMHSVVAELNQRAGDLGVDAMFRVRWGLSKRAVPDGDYTRYEPHFEPLGVAGEPNGPTEAEIVKAKRLSATVGQISYANPDIQVRLVVGGSPQAEPPPVDPEDPGWTPDDTY